MEKIQSPSAAGKVEASESCDYSGSGVLNISIVNLHIIIIDCTDRIMRHTLKDPGACLMHDAYYLNGGLNMKLCSTQETSLFQK